MKFVHKALSMSKKTKIVYIAMSKHNFYFGKHAVKFTLRHGCTPILPFGIFDYFLLDSVRRNIIRQANNNLLRISDELWAFGSVSDGVLVEIKLAKKTGKPVKYFAIVNSKKAKMVSKPKFEEDVAEFSGEI